MALQFRRYPRSQVFAFDFGGSIRAAALAMGGDWHDLGGAISEDVPDPVAPPPLAGIDEAGERAWAADWLVAIPPLEPRAPPPRCKDSPCPPPPPPPAPPAAPRPPPAS